MKKVFLFLWILVNVIRQSYAQNSDSLWKTYNNRSVADTLRLQAIDDMAWVYLYNNPDTSIALAIRQIKFAEEVKNKKHIGIANSTIGSAYMLKGNYPKSVEYFSKSLVVRREINDKRGVAVCYNNLGLVYKEQANYTHALENYLKALKIFEELGNKATQAACYGNIGVVYQENANSSKAREYQLKSLKIREEIGDKQGVATCYGNLALIYKQEANFTQALEFYFKGAKIAEEINDKNDLGNFCNNIGNIYLSKKDYPHAKAYYLKSLQIQKETGQVHDAAISYNNMAALYDGMKEYKLSLLYSDSALQISKKIKATNTERLAYSRLAEVFAKTKRYKDAYENHVLYKVLTDSIFNSENSKQLGDMKTKFEVEKKETELKAKAEAREIINAEEKKGQRKTLILVSCILILMVVFSIFLYRRYKITQKQKHIIELQKDEVSRQKVIVEQQKHEVEIQKHLVEEHQKEIIDSITYAKRLQTAILPPDAFIKQYLPDTFIYYYPKDIVAGDFYWMEHKDNHTFIAAADSTGHGVPGAMVSVVCSNALNRAVNEFGLRETGKILDKTRELVLETFSKSGEEIKDGMDISLCRINTATGDVQWSGANNQLWYIGKDNREMSEIKADKQPIGKTDNPIPFAAHKMKLQKGAIIYLMTDGYPDQFGGPKGKKFKYKQLEALLVSNSKKSPEEQKKILNETFEGWKGNLEQVDDVTIIGIKL
jgi:serine phosphatase RsbU (regulator of sigma subunit)/tetratricopeptide (TPR) repeat protein